MNRRIFAYLVGVAVFLSVGFGWLSFLATVPVSVQPAVSVEIARGQSAGEVAQQLQEKGIIRSARALLLMARMQGLDRAFRHGEHIFEGALTPEQVLREICTDPQPTVRVTIPEGLTWLEVGRLLEDQGIVSADAYYQAVCSPELLKKAGASPKANCAEGFLYPDTYNLTPNMSAVEIAHLQLQRFRTVIKELLEELSFDPSAVADAMVLASIIEKETSRGDERPLVSSVFHNRLRRGMRLQADPTVIYGLQAAGTPWDGTLLHKQLRKPGPYNTYTEVGLPPGPICNPGKAALHAALAPADSAYIYFVATGDGTHRFSQTLEQHNQAVAQLRRR